MFLYLKCISLIILIEAWKVLYQLSNECEVCRTLYVTFKRYYKHYFSDNPYGFSFTDKFTNLDNRLTLFLFKQNYSKLNFSDYYGLKFVTI